MGMMGYVVAAGILVVICAVAANRLLKVGCVLRERAVLLSDTLLNDDRFPVELKVEIDSVVPFLADYAAAWHVVQAFAMLLFVRHSDVPEPDFPPELVRQWRDLQRVSILAALTNSLTALAVFLLVLMVTSYFIAFNRIADGIMIKLSGWSTLNAGGWESSGLNAAR